MVSETRKSEMRDYMRSRQAARRGIGQVTRTCWIQEEDADAFVAAIRPFTDRARLLEAVNGTLPLSKLEIFGIIREHKLPYEPEEMFFLSRVAESLTLNPEKADKIVDAAHRIINKYPETNLSGVLKRIDELLPQIGHGPDEAQTDAGMEP